MKTYQKRTPNTVSAIQFTGTNIDEILVAVPDQTGHKIVDVLGGRYLTILRPTRNLQLRIGDYLVWKDNNTPYDVPQLAFEATYEELEVSV